MEIFVTKRDGSKERFNANEMNKSVEEACVGLPNPTEKAMRIASETQVTLYDGMTTKELDSLLINVTLQNIVDDPIVYDKIACRLVLKNLYRDIVGDYEHDKGLLEKNHKKTFIEFIKNGVRDNILDERMESAFDLKQISEALNIKNDEEFKYSGLSTMLARYSIKSKEQKPAETPQMFFMRVAMGLSFNEKDPNAAAILFYKKMSSLKYIAGGSTNINAGTTRPALSNCFLLQVEDDMEHIAKSISDVLMISKATGGIGVNITKLRAGGSTLSSNNTRSSGPVSFVKIMDVAVHAVMRGGKKKGAAAIYMENWHLDFEAFIDWRHNAGDEHLRMRTVNTAALLSDEFMKRVEREEEWYMFDPKETSDLVELYGKDFSKRYNEYVKKAEAGELELFKKVPARDQIKRILASLQSTAHPWVTWKDPMNIRALNNNTGTIHMSNLCTEICLPQDKDNIAVCNLASVNIARHISEEGEVDWESLKGTVKLAMQHLDNLIDINILPIKEADKSDKENRAVGLGVMGFSDALEKLGLSYDSEQAYAFTDRVFEFISYYAIDKSAQLAEERGSYKNFKGSMWSKGFVPMDTIDKLDEDRGVSVDVTRETSGKVDWDALRVKVKKGMRNATVLAVAPNANIGLVGGTTPGVDPRFTQAFSRNKASGKYFDINHNMVKDLKDIGLWTQVKDKVIESHGDIADIEVIPERLKNIYKTSFTTSPYGFINVAARAQKYIDQAISRNMYLDIRDIDKIVNVYTDAWRKGLKTTYYLHMKPRHSAEQSTIAVNKAHELGFKGFAGVSKKREAGFGKLKHGLELSKKGSEEQKAEKVLNTCPIDPQEKLQCDSCQ